MYNLAKEPHATVEFYGGRRIDVEAHTLERRGPRCGLEANRTRGARVREIPREDGPRDSRRPPDRLGHDPQLVERGVQLRGIAVDAERARAAPARPRHSRRSAGRPTASLRAAPPADPTPRRRRPCTSRIATPIRSWQARNRSGSGLARMTSPALDDDHVLDRCPAPPARRRSPAAGPMVAIPYGTPQLAQVARGGPPHRGAAAARAAARGTARRGDAWICSTSSSLSGRPSSRATARVKRPPLIPMRRWIRQPSTGSARLGQRPLPGEDVGVDGVDQRAVQVEDQRSRHVANLRPSLLADD